MKKVLQWRKRNPPQTKESQVPVVEHLRKVDVFKDLSHEEIEELFHGMMVRDCQPGTVFFMPEDSTERLFVLKTGQVELYRLTPNGKRLVTRRIEPGTVFGEMGLVGQTMEGCFAEVTENALVCIATRQDVLQLIKDHPEVGLRLLEAMGKRMRLIEDRLEQASFGSVRVRLANFLLTNTDSGTGVVSGYTHEVIGDTIGALRQTVTETLNQMRSQGLVELGHKRIKIIDRMRLEEIVAEGD